MNRGNPLLVKGSLFADAAPPCSFVIHGHCHTASTSMGLREKGYRGYGANEMNVFWAIKCHPGEVLLAMKVLLSADVRRVLGHRYVTALCVFSSKDKLNVFTENVRLGVASQYPELAPVLQKIARGEIRGREVRFTLQELLGVVEAAGAEYYVALTLTRQSNKYGARKPSRNTSRRTNSTVHTTPTRRRKGYAPLHTLGVELSFPRTANAGSLVSEKATSRQ